MRIKVVVLCLIGILLLSILTACSAETKTSASKGNSGEEKKTDEAIIYATSKDINDMNPHLYTGSMSAQGMVYESLIENTADGIKPLLAESWEISADGKVYTFNLRKDVTFHDGEPFNAEAVKKNIDAVNDNAEKHAWIKLSTKIQQVKVVDEFTVELSLSEPYYPTLVELSMTRPYVFLSPNDFVDGRTKDGVKGFNGTGPYRLTEHKTDQYATFEANDDYWGGSPNVKKIISKVLPAGETTFLALKKGEINFAFTDDRGADSLDIEAMEGLEHSGDYVITRSEPMNTKMIVANSSLASSPVHEKAVREAIWHAIDRKTITEDLLSGTETVATTLFSQNVNYANVPLTERNFDEEKAKELLEKSGWQFIESAEYRTKNGKELAFKLYYDSNSSSQKIQAEFIQSSLKGIGVRLDIVGEESTSIANRRATGDYELLFNQTWGLAYDPQSTIAAFTTPSSYLHTTRGIPQADELYEKIEQVMVSQDEETRTALYADIMTIVHDEAIFIPISNGSVTVIAPTNLKGLTFKQTQYELPFEQLYFE